MATRRIPALCLASSSRNALFVAAAGARTQRRAVLAPLARQFNSTGWRREQQQANVGAKRDPAPKIVRGASKVYKDADAAVADLKSGSTLLSAGFGLCGTAGTFALLHALSSELGNRGRLTLWYIETIIAAIEKRGSSLGNLTAVSNNAGAAGGGLSPLVASGQITRCIMSFLGANKALEKKYLNGEIAIELCPQGTIAERIRAAGAGIPAFFTPTGVSKYKPQPYLPGFGVDVGGRYVRPNGRNPRQTRRWW